MARLSPRAWLVLAGLCLFAPAFFRPLFVDDHAHFQEALDLSRHFAVPYNAQGLGWTPGSAPSEANPPLYFYLIGGWARLAGPAPWKARLLLLPLQILGLLSFHSLARRYTRHALWAALLWLCTPHFLLTADSLLLDGLLAPLMLAGLALWMDGWERNNPWRLSGAGILLGAAALVKYTGVLGWAAAALWTALESREKKSARWFFLLFPGLMLGAWALWTRSLYGEPHMSAVARGSVAALSLPRLASLGAFMGGTTPCLLLVPAALGTAPGWRRSAMGALILLALAAGLALAPRAGVGLQEGLWLGGTAAWALCLDGDMDGTNLFLLGWTGLGLAGLSTARGWICARYLVVVGPALVLLTVRTLERRAAHRADSPLFRRVSLAALAGFAALLLHADIREARVDRRAAAEMEAWRAAHRPASPACFPSATLSGLGFYLDPLGWKPIDAGAAPPAGAVTAVPSRGLPRFFLPRLENATLLSRFDYRSWNPLRTWDPPSGAGFYGSLWGPLPFSFSRGPLEVYFLAEVPDAAPQVIK